MISVMELYMCERSVPACGFSLQLRSFFLKRNAAVFIYLYIFGASARLDELPVHNSWSWTCSVLTNGWSTVVTCDRWRNQVVVTESVRWRIGRSLQTTQEVHCWREFEYARYIDWIRWEIIRLGFSFAPCIKTCKSIKFSNHCLNENIVTLSLVYRTC